MNTNLRILPLATDETRGQEYDVFLAAVGYERRARFLSERLKPRARMKHAAAFTDRRELSFDDNMRYYRESGFVIKEPDESEFHKWVDAVLSEGVSDAEALRVIVDISSQTRFRMAAILAKIAQIGARVGVVADFLYSAGSFCRPVEYSGPITSADPVHPYYAGWSDKPERPNVAIFGLGYEPDRALGALEFLEASEVWGFEASDGDKRFHSLVRKANRAFWAAAPRGQRVLYRASDPFETFVTLESIVAGALSYARPIIVPFGPKVFACAALAVATVHLPAVAVWRVSSGDQPPPQDVRPSGRLYGLRFAFNPV